MTDNSSPRPWRPALHTAGRPELTEFWRARNVAAMARLMDGRSQTPLQALCARDAVLCRPERVQRFGLAQFNGRDEIGPMIFVPRARVREAKAVAATAGWSSAELLRRFATVVPGLPESVLFLFPDAEPVVAGEARLGLTGALVGGRAGWARTCTPYGNVVAVASRDRLAGARVVRDWFADGWRDRAMPPVAPLGRLICGDGDGPVGSDGREVPLDAVMPDRVLWMGAARWPVAWPDHADALLTRPEGVPGAIQLTRFDALRMGLRASRTLTAEHERALLMVSGWVQAQLEVVAMVVAMFAEGHWLAPRA